MEELRPEFFHANPPLNLTFLFCFIECDLQILWHHPFSNRFVTVEIIAILPKVRNNTTIANENSCHDNYYHGRWEIVIEIDAVGQLFVALSLKKPTSMCVNTP